MISSQYWLISVIEIWGGGGGGGESIYFEIWGGYGPPGPPGSSAYGTHCTIRTPLHNQDTPT